MIKKFFVAVVVIFTIIWSCQKDCTEYKQYKIPAVSVVVNTENKGIMLTQPLNVGDTIRSLSNQFYFYPSIEYLALRQLQPVFSLFPQAYAGDCPVLDLSTTTFSAPLTQFSMDVAFPAGLYGIAPYADVAAGENLLSYPDIKNTYFTSFLENKEVFSGYAAPINISPMFFKHLRGQDIKFVIGFVTTEGLNRNDTVSAHIDVNI